MIISHEFFKIIVRARLDFWSYEAYWDWVLLLIYICIDWFLFEYDLFRIISCPEKNRKNLNDIFLWRYKSIFYSCVHEKQNKSFVIRIAQSGYYYGLAMFNTITYYIGSGYRIEGINRNKDRWCMMNLGGGGGVVQKPCTAHATPIPPYYDTLIIRYILFVRAFHND